MITTVGFDADDTLWQNERAFRDTQARFAALLAPHADEADLMARLLAAERRNLGHYGFGVKGFVLSMIETALEVTERRVDGAVIDALLAMGREMLAHPIDLLPGAEATVLALRGRVRLILVTKGDLLDQERKLAQSGLGDAFDAVEIVRDKTPAVYDRIFARHGDGAARSMMVGNSVKSDVLPAIAAGAWGVWVPHALTWEMERAAPPEDSPRFAKIGALDELPALVDNML